MLQRMMVMSVILALCFVQLNGQQSMEEQYCTRAKSTPDHVVLTTSYAPSLITCAFICKDNRDCRTFAFSNNVCTLYWKPADRTVNNPGTTSPVTCSTNRKVCPASIDGGKYRCTYSSAYQFCLCISSEKLTIADATTSCKYYNMDMVSVQNAGKNAFIKSYLNNQTSDVLCAWTSGVRDTVDPNSFIWSSIGTKADVTINPSVYVGTGAKYLGYAVWTPEGKWRWDDLTEINDCRPLCEFQPE